MDIVENATSPNQFIVTVTGGEVMALWQCLEDKRVEDGGELLLPVKYDCWLQLNRAMETIAPEFVKIHK